MTEQELIERIAHEGVNLYAFPNLWKRLNKTEKGNWYSWAKGKILSLFKEAGYKSPEEVKDLLDKKDIYFEEFRKETNKEFQTLLTKAREGYVKLATDQTLPEIPEFAYDKLEERRLLKRGAINYSKLLAGWRKVE